MDLAERIADVVRPTLTAMGYALVRVQVQGRQRATLQIMAERADGQPMMLEDCAAVSRMLSPVLDVADPIPAAYTLEVSSPGIDRPLVQLADYDRFTGFEARVETVRPLDGRRRFSGRLLGTAEERVRIATETGEVEVPFGEIQRGKLLLTDDLLALHAKAQRGEQGNGDEQSPD